MTVDPQGDVVLVDQAGSDLVFLHHAGSSQQTVTHVPAGTQLEDTVWVNADKGKLFVVDATTNTVYTLSGDLVPGAVYAEAPNDSGVANWVGTIDLSSGTISPIAIGFGKATGLLFVPDPGATAVTPAATASNSSVPPIGAAAAAAASSGTASSPELQATQAGTLAGNTGGSFAPYQLTSPTGSPVTLTLLLGALDAAQAHRVGITVYQGGAQIGGVTAQSTGLGDPTNSTSPSLTVAPSASGGPVTVRVFNYTPNQVSFTLIRS